MLRFKYVFLLILLAGVILLLNMKEEKASGITIGFYNVENLFDTINDPHARDDDFLPESKLKWTRFRYEQKLYNLSCVLDKLGDEDGPEILGIAEIENDMVLKDLLHSALIKDKHYRFIHKESEDRRGIDVALIYKAKVFKPFFTKSYPVVFPFNKEIKTRSILLVGGTIEKDSFYIFVNHWPSRRGGVKESESKRMTVSLKLKSLVDSLLNFKPDSRIIIMGDLNDNPFNKSVKSLLEVKKFPIMINPFYEIEKEGRGTIKFKGQWDLFDQIIISESILNGKEHHYINGSASVYDPVWLYYKENSHNGPYRTYSGIKYNGGYSDHFPVYLHLSK